MSIIKEKLKEVSMSVIPVSLIVLLINFTLVKMNNEVIYRFILGSILIIIGLTIFLLGVDIGITPLGGKLGNALAKSNKIWIVGLSGLILGFFISIAEPGLLVLGNQVEIVTNGAITATTLFVVVSIGLASMISLGFLRIFYNVSLRTVLLVTYLFIFLLSFSVSEEFLGLAFDASGATTGILAVPFILALSTGISKLKKNIDDAEKDSFGLVAIASSGAIIAVMLLDVLTPASGFSSDLKLENMNNSGIIQPFLKLIPSSLQESVVSLGPILFIYLVLQFFVFKLRKRENRGIIFGFIFSLVGLIIFLIGVNGGFMEVGVILGEKLSLMENRFWLIISAFILGLVTIIAEPAVYVLTNQIEDVTAGFVKKKYIYSSLGIGVGVAVAFSALRIVIPTLKLWHILLPGYIIALGLTFFTPELFVGIAFDAGGVATGPITATFILAFVQGAANAVKSASLLVDGFGMIALVAMTPIIALQILGIMFMLKTKKNIEEM